jgi:hypothetical protein
VGTGGKLPTLQGKEKDRNKTAVDYYTPLTESLVPSFHMIFTANAIDVRLTQIGMRNIMTLMNRLNR